MEEVGVRALKQNASAVVARVAAGESIVITDRGRRVAQISPLEELTIARLVAAGLARPPRKPLEGLPAPSLRADVSEALRELREDERY